MSPLYVILSVLVVGVLMRPVVWWTAPWTSRGARCANAALDVSTVLISGSITTLAVYLIAVAR